MFRWAYEGLSCGIRNCREINWLWHIGLCCLHLWDQEKCAGLPKLVASDSSQEAVLFNIHAKVDRINGLGTVEIVDQDMSARLSYVINLKTLLCFCFLFLS